MTQTTSLTDLRRPAVATGAPAQQTAKKLSLLTAMAKNFQMEPAAFMAAIKATVMRPDKNGQRASDAEIAAFLAMAHEYKLNPFTKQIHAFKDKDGTVIPVIGIDGWVELVNRHPQFDGLEFEFKDTPEGAPYAVTCIMYRKDRARPVKVTEFFEECFAHAKSRTFQNPWSTHPRRMLRHKAYAQCARLAFGFGGLRDETDAMEGEWTQVGSDAPAEFHPEQQAGETIDQHGEIHAIEHQPANTVPAMEIPEEHADEFVHAAAPEAAPARAANGVSEPGFAFE